VVGGPASVAGKAAPVPEVLATTFGRPTPDVCKLALAAGGSVPEKLDRL
jgi:hypothetical protein